MEPNRLGRALGIGARVAAKKLRDGTAGAVAAVQRSNAAQPAPTATTPPKPVEPATPSAPSMAEGSRPLAHATGILTLQITGSFFAIFTLVFAVHSWQLYKSAGWHDHHLPLYAAFAVLFAWFTVSSFWRANRKQKGSGRPRVARS